MRRPSAYAFACVSLCETVIACMCLRVCLSLPFDCHLNLWHVQQSNETADWQSGGRETEGERQKEREKVDVHVGGGGSRRAVEKQEREEEVQEKEEEEEMRTGGREREGERCERES